MLVSIILSLIVLVNGVFAFKFVKDYWGHRKETMDESGSTPFYASWSVFVWFLSTFGISDFAISTVVYRLRNLVPDQKLPGTLNTQCVIPVAVMALAYISSIEADPLTLVACIIAQVAGSYLGPRYVVKLPAQYIRIGMGCGLMLVTCFILASKFKLVPAGGTATGLSGIQLIIACVALFIYGALNNIGIGSYAPTMVTIYALGLNPAVAFPVMMGACAFSVPVGSMEFVRLGVYGRKATLFGATFGIMGVLIAVYIVKSLDVSMLQWVIAAVVAFAGFNMLWNEFKPQSHSQVS